MRNLGLLGKNISYSYSQQFFVEKFYNLGIKNIEYHIFDYPDLQNIEELFAKEGLIGFNVTIPYKQEIIQYLDEITPAVKEVGAVNTVVIKNRKKIGYNTDIFGFESTLLPMLKPNHKKALILGTGGAAKAVSYILRKQEIPCRLVSRKSSSQNLSYEELDEKIMNKHLIIINCTPLGTFPKIDDFPPIPFQHITKNHFLYDLTYNPSVTTFLKKGKEKGCQIFGGLEMLFAQANESWRIWQREI